MELLEIQTQGPTGYVLITEVRKASPNMHGNNHGTSADSIARGPPKGFLSRFADDEANAQTLSTQAGVAVGRGRGQRRLASPPGSRGLALLPAAALGSQLSGAPCRRAGGPFSPRGWAGIGRFA